MDLFQDAKAASIVSVAERLGLHVYRGNWIHCVDHKNGNGVDEHASCSLSLKTNRFRCWSCGNSGSTIDLAAQVMGCSPKEAAGWILVDSPAPPKPVELFLPQARLSQILTGLMALCPLGPTGRTYLHARHIEGRGVGEVVDYPATQQIMRATYSQQELVKAGVFSAKGNLKFYKHTLLFPFMENGRPVYLQSRRLDDEKPKYLSTNGPVPCLYNVDALEQDGPVWLCEGITDTLTLVTEKAIAVGIVGAFGFKKEWAHHFAGRHVVLALDEDAAGKSGRELIHRQLLEAGATVAFASLPPGQDVNGYYRSTGLIPEEKPCT